MSDVRRFGAVIHGVPERIGTSPRWYRSILATARGVRLAEVGVRVLEDRAWVRVEELTA